MVVVAVQLSVMGLYLPPVLKKTPEACPPQTIISVSVQTAACQSLAAGTPLVLVAVQLSVMGLYLPPVLRLWLTDPPHTIISLPVHTAV